MAVVVSPIIMESLTLPSKMNQVCFLNHLNRVNIVILVIMCVCGLLPTGRIIRDSKSVDLREIYKKKGETVDDKKLEFHEIVSPLFIVILSALYDGPVIVQNRKKAFEMFSFFNFNLKVPQQCFI